MPKLPPALIVSKPAPDISHYQIVHSPSGAILASNYYFRSTALAISKEIIVALGDSLRNENKAEVAALFTQGMKDYIEFYRFSEEKKPLSLEEWLNGTDYESILTRRRAESILERQEREHAEELYHSDKSLGWIPEPGGTMAGADLANLIAGRPTPSEKVLERAKAEGDIK